MKGSAFYITLQTVRSKRAFVREELMQIPEGTEVPPDWVKEW